MRHTHIFFDLDGTLVESAPGIIESLLHALRSLGVEPSELDERLVVGPPILESLQGLFGLSPAEAERGLQIYRAYYREKGCFKASLYPGIAELIHGLAAQGAALFLATSKLEEHAALMLRHFGLASHFRCIGGGGGGSAEAHKAAVLRRVLREHPLPRSAAAIMVGDTRYDVLGAHELGLPCAGVLYGYGTRRDLEDAGADFLIPDVRALTEFLQV